MTQEKGCIPGKGTLFLSGVDTTTLLFRQAFALFPDVPVSSAEKTNERKKGVYLSLQPGTENSSDSRESYRLDITQKKFALLRHTLRVFSGGYKHYGN